MAVQGQLNWPIVQDYVNANVHLLLLGLFTAVLAYLARGIFLKPRVPAISVPLPAQAQPGWRSTVLEEPSIFGNDPSLIQCYCPATGQLIGTVNLATRDTVDQAIGKAKAAQLKWRNTTFEQRAQVLRTLLKFILEHQEDIARVSCRDSGVLRHFDPAFNLQKTMIDASLGEILVTCEKLRWLIANGKNVLRPEKRPVTSLLMMHKTAEIRYEPLGVVAALVSWNYPVRQSMVSFAKDSFIM